MHLSRNVVLEFPDLKTMVDFTLNVDAHNFEQIRSRFILICELTEADIALARLKYNAVVIEDKKSV